MKQMILLRSMSPALGGWALGILAALLGWFFLPLAVWSASVPEPKPALGMNLNGPADWNTELPFVDVFRLSRQWISQKKGQPWGKGPVLELDAQGWVKRLEPSQGSRRGLAGVIRRGQTVKSFGRKNQTFRWFGIHAFFSFSCPGVPPRIQQ